IGKEVGCGVSLEGVALLNLAATAWDMHLGLAEFHVGKLGGGLFQDRVVGFAGLTGCETIGDDRCGRVGEFLVIFVSDVFDNSSHKVVKSKVRKSKSLNVQTFDFRT